MDKNLLLAILLSTLILFAYFFYLTQVSNQPQPTTTSIASSQSITSTTTSTTVTQPTPKTTKQLQPTRTIKETVIPLTATSQYPLPYYPYYIENNLLKVFFSPLEGGVYAVYFKKYPKIDGVSRIYYTNILPLSVIFTSLSHMNERTKAYYTLDSITPTNAILHADYVNTLTGNTTFRVIKEFSFPYKDAYLISLKITIKNLSSKPQIIKAYRGDTGHEETGLYIE